MEAVIKVSGDEFDENLFNKIKLLLKSINTSSETEIVIRIGTRVASGLLEEDSAAYLTKLNRSIKEVEEGKGMTFTMQELEAYLNKNFHK